VSDALEVIVHLDSEIELFALLLQDLTFEVLRVTP
jgi:hypothetical protein